MLPEEINAFLDLQLSHGFTLDTAISRLMRVMMIQRRMSAAAVAQALLAARVKERYDAGELGSLQRWGASPTTYPGNSPQRIARHA
jgi:hypothetical protein